MPWSKIKPIHDEPDAFDVAGETGRRLTYPESIREGLCQALAADPRVFVMGQGVDDPGAMFGTTAGLQDAFGPDRVFDTPLAETALTGIAAGAALGGMRPVYLHNRPDFLFLAMDALVNHAAKWSFMFHGAVGVPLVVWACTGRGWGSAAQHSQALQGLFAHVPGLKVVMPATCFDAKGLMLSAIRDPNPVLVLEHRFNFKQIGQVPESPYTVPLGKGAIRRCGRDATVVAVSHLVAEAFSAAESLAGCGIDAEVIDPRSVKPLDEALILASVRKTGRLVIADTGWKTCGLASEISALVAEKAFDALQAPILRVTAPDLPTPAGHSLEAAYYVGQKEIGRAIERVCRR